MSTPKLIVKLDKPTYGNWDGGKRDTFEFKPDNRIPYIHPGPGGDIRWGSFTANFWFWAKAGRTNKEALSIAKRMLKKIIGVPCKFEEREKR